MKSSALRGTREGMGAQQLLGNYSIEITARDTPELAEASGILAPGTRVSITFLPNEPAEKRVAAAEEISRLRLNPVPHISARRIGSKDDLVAYLEALSRAGACEEMFVVAGDKATPGGPYPDALAIINSGLLAHYGVRHVSIAGYPEGHPNIDNEKLWTALCDKVNTLKTQGVSTSILTQFGFNTEPVFSWLEELRARGVDAPVRLGIPGPASAATLMKFAARCGVAASSSMLKKFGLTLTKLRQTSGPELYVTDLMDGLYPKMHGEVGLHFYPFGGLVNTARWIEAFERHNCS